MGMPYSVNTYPGYPQQQMMPPGANPINMGLLMGMQKDWGQLAQESPNKRLNQVQKLDFS
jgi:hypothetical protein